MSLGKLAANSVDSSKIVDGSIVTTDIRYTLLKNQNIFRKQHFQMLKSHRIAALAITDALLAADSVIEEKILDGAVSLGKLAANSVDSSKIVDGSIATADIRIFRF